MTYIHKTLGEGIIVEDKINILRKGEVMFQPTDKSIFLGINYSPTNWSEAATEDIVLMSDLTLVK